jgi:hypothetical protein
MPWTLFLPFRSRLPPCRTPRTAVPISDEPGGMDSWIFSDVLSAAIHTAAWIAAADSISSTDGE